MTRIGHDGGGFAFDNEGPAHDTLLGRFHLANRLVTQHEYLAFIRDGGYSRPELWLSQDGTASARLARAALLGSATTGKSSHCTACRNWSCRRLSRT